MLLCSVGRSLRSVQFIYFVKANPLPATTRLTCVFIICSLVRCDGRWCKEHENEVERALAEKIAIRWSLGIQPEPDKQDRRQKSR